LVDGREDVRRFNQEEKEPEKIRVKLFGWHVGGPWQYCKGRKKILEKGVRIEGGEEKYSSKNDGSNKGNGQQSEKDEGLSEKPEPCRGGRQSPVDRDSLEFLVWGESRA